MYKEWLFIIAKSQVLSVKDKNWVIFKHGRILKLLKEVIMNFLNIRLLWLLLTVTNNVEILRWFQSKQWGN